MTRGLGFRGQAAPVTDEPPRVAAMYVRVPLFCRAQAHAHVVHRMAHDMVRMWGPLYLRNLFMDSLAAKEFASVGLSFEREACRPIVLIGRRPLNAAREA